MTGTTKAIVTVAALAAVGGAIYLATRPTAPASAPKTASSTPWWSQLIRGTVDVGLSLYHDLSAKKSGDAYTVPNSGAAYTGGGSSGSNTVLA